MDPDSRWSLERLLTEPVFSDFIISCKGVDFKVHQAFLVANSTFFRSVCTLPFQEAEQNHVDLVDEEPEIIARMLSYMYTGDYDDAQIPRWAEERCIVSPPCSQTQTIKDKEGLYGASEVQTESSDGKIPAGEEEWGKKISRSGKEGSKKASLSRMEVNTLVYACGDKLGIRYLKAAATEKFARSIAEEYKSKHFQEAIELVFRVTAPGDSEIRSELLLWYIRHREAVTGNLAKTMAEHEPLTWKVYLEMGEALDAQKEGYASCLAKLDARNAEIKEKDAKLRTRDAELRGVREPVLGAKLTLSKMNI
ncbi:hypothetical protein EPUS_06037 [Endocarpon pusillum Z07020]|uniref:BTB domain-containing protein n=1 Tax=Endocarpon pusillum (strain Z07020 / HMAS-L-300199) TaxID=1263415 RepID=U1GJR7_ENDPU|nr:uncharacterized protein EPUS_06037 [Endocarpon pusillum Z07020]ERF72408.1 hypothetical protein EPUS_06037 [Endocarpon pusillum Z07020]